MPREHPLRRLRVLADAIVANMSHIDFSAPTRLPLVKPGQNLMAGGSSVPNTSGATYSLPILQDVALELALELGLLENDMDIYFPLGTL